MSWSAAAGFFLSERERKLERVSEATKYCFFACDSTVTVVCQYAMQQRGALARHTGRGSVRTYIYIYPSWWASVQGVENRRPSYCDRYTAWRDTAPLAAQSEDLRPYWRGTSGRSKEDQASFFVACGGDARGIPCVSRHMVFFSGDDVFDVAPCAAVVI